jgi:hypothetical protein
MEIERKFWALVEETRRLDDESDDVRVCEPPMIEAILLVRAYPESRQFFVKAFGQIISGEKASSDWFIPFCMRTLRLPEVADLTKADMKVRQSTGSSARHMNFYSDVFHAYDDDVWEHADLWPFYAHEIKKA